MQSGHLMGVGASSGPRRRQPKLRGVRVCGPAPFTPGRGGGRQRCPGSHTRARRLVRCRGGAAHPSPLSSSAQDGDALSWHLAGNLTQEAPCDNSVPFCGFWRNLGSSPVGLMMQQQGLMVLEMTVAVLSWGGGSRGHAPPLAREASAAFYALLIFSGRLASRRFHTLQVANQ